MSMAASSASAVAAIAASHIAKRKRDDDAEYAKLPVNFEDVGMAAFRIRNGIKKTECSHSPAMSDLTGCEVYFKHDHRQVTGSFKERGALNTLLLIDEEQRRIGVIAASAGNHALALAYHGKRLGIPVTVVMPHIAPITKVGRCRSYGATVHLHGENIAEAKERAMQLVESSGLLYVNGYDDPSIVAGAGTLGLEISEQVPDVNYVLVPVGGAGLIAGVSLALKMLIPEVVIIGVEPANCPSMTRALEAGHPVMAECKATLADGLAVPMVGENAFRVAHKFVDKVVTVSEKWIALAVLRMVETEKTVAEGGGIAGLAALLSGQLPELKGKKVVIPVCGGNIDTSVLGRVIERGLASDGRLVQFNVTISDRPGGLAAFTKLVATTGASVKDIFHERAFLDSDMMTINVRCVIETRDMKHAESLLAQLGQAGYAVDYDTCSLYKITKQAARSQNVDALPQLLQRETPLAAEAVANGSSPALTAKK